LVTPLRISSGRASVDTDAPFIRNFGGTPYIPGSSLRGAIRSEVERIISTVGSKIGLSSCILFEKDSCAERSREFLRQLKDDENDRGTSDEKIIEFASKELCDVCRLFGSTVYASRLTIEDAMLDKPEQKGIAAKRLCIRDGVGIDRDTGAAKDGAKFDYEVIDPDSGGPSFSFKMTAENVMEQDIKLINLILSLLKSGLYVGGKRSGGLGKIKLFDDVKKTGFENPDDLWDMLTKKQDIEAGKVTWKEGF
jgi:CRISPR-associated RAMP protein (TIGR02581 family)